MAGEAPNNDFARDEPLQRSVLFTHLDGAQGGAWRLNRFDEIDLLMVVIPYWLHQLAEFLLGGSPARAIATLVAMCVAVYVLRTKFPDGLLPLVRVLGMPRRLSALAADRGCQTASPYPVARALRRQEGRR